VAEDTDAIVPKKLEAAIAATSRSAAVLFWTCTIGIIAIFAVNTTQMRLDNRREAAQEAYYERREALCRYQVYSRGGAVLYQTLALSAIVDELHREVKLRAPCRSGIEAHLEAYEKVLSSKHQQYFQERALCFGQRVAAGLEAQDVETSKRSLSLAVDSCFEDTWIRKRMKRPDVLEIFVQAKDPNYWPQMAGWVVSGMLPYWFYGMGGFDRRPLARFGQTPESFGSWEQRRLYDAIIVDSTPEWVNKEMRASLATAFDKVARASETAEMPVISLPGTGSALKADELIMFLGPLILVMQVAFYLNWRRQIRVLTRLGISDDLVNEISDTFPRFSSPLDPLVNIRASDLGELLARTSWLWFLLLPILIAATAVAVRYDLRVLPTDFSDLRLLWMYGIRFYRSHDPTSLALDFVNLVVLGVTLGITANLTSEDGVSPPPRSALLYRLVKLAEIIFVTVWIWRVHGLITNEYRFWHWPGLIPVVADFVVYLGFGCVWAYALRRAVASRLPTLGWVSVVGFIMAFLMLV